MNIDFNRYNVCMACDIKYPKTLQMIRCLRCNQKLRIKPRNSKARKIATPKRIT